jgi:DNA-binding GntR family transcriptional regulator
LAESEGSIRQIGASGGWSRLRPLALQAGTTAQAQVYAVLRQVLMSGHFRPGEEISLRQAAAALGTSVTPVREALRQLESEGGLEVHGRNRVLRVPVITPEELFEVRDIRVQLEGMATEAAACLIGPGQMRLVTNACRLMERAVEAQDADGYLENNWRFHSLIYAAARRPILLGLIEGMWMRVGPLIRLSLHRPGHLAHSMECHRAAEAALHAGDAAAARAAIARDISGAASDLVDVLGEPLQKRSRR